jgi:hypothetical protein
MYSLMSFRKRSRGPFAFSVPGYTSKEGKRHEPQITIHPFGLPQVGDRVTDTSPW